MAKKPKVLKVQNGGCFDDLDIREDVEEIQEKGRKLDMFKQVLPALDRRNFEFYGSLTDAEKKGYAPLVIQRWMSSTNGDHNFTHHKHLLDVNEFVNVDFWTLSKHPELQHKLMCLCGMGTNQRHQWIPMLKKTKSKSKIDAYFSKLYPRLNQMEISLLKRDMTNEDFENLLREQGLQEKELKAQLKVWKDEKKKGI